MCELFALTSNRPANATFSLGIFGERGGRLGPHKDGWGIAFKEGRDFRLIKVPTPASDSACLSFVESHEFRSEIVLSHIRLASVPRLALEPAQDDFQHVSLIATQPLTTNEAWLALPPGEAVVFHRGQRIF